MNKKRAIILSCTVLGLLVLSFVTVCFAKYIENHEAGFNLSVLFRRYEERTITYKDSDAYTFENGNLTVKATYFEEATQKWCKTVGIDENGFSSTTYADRDGIQSVFIPKTVNTIGANALACTNLESISVDENNSAYSSESGNLFNKDKTTLIRYSPAKADTFYIVPTSVTKIENNAFQYAETCTAIVTTLYDDAAWGATRAIMVHAFELSNQEICNIIKKKL